MPVYTVSPLGIALAGDFRFRVLQGSVELLGATLTASDGWQEYSYPLNIVSLPVVYPVEPNSSIETSCNIAEVPESHALIHSPHLGESIKEARVLVCGSKNVGKSTFVRFLLNAKMAVNKTVVFVDIDPGQPEIGSPGCISYSVMHNYNFRYGISDQPKTSLFYGHLSPSHDIRKFLAQIKKIGNLVGSQPDISDCHVVVNSHGWLQGLGEFTVQYTAVHLSISSLLKIHSSTETTIPGEAFWSTVDNPFLDQTEIDKLADMRKLKTQISIVTKPGVSAHELRWLRIASCLGGRNFRSINPRTGLHQDEFFTCHQGIRLPLGAVRHSCEGKKLEVIQEALTGTLVGLLDGQQFLRCLGFISAVTEDMCVILVSEEVDVADVVQAVRPSFNFSSRDTHMFDRGGLKEEVKADLYWSSESLGGLESGARSLKNRTNLGRKRLNGNN